MKTAKNGLVRQYHNACVKIAEKFWHKYYHEEMEMNFEEAFDDGGGYFCPIGGEADSIWEMEANEWWQVSDMATALELRATKKQVEEWQEKTTYGKREISLKNFLKWEGWEMPEISGEEKEQLKKNVEKARKSFEEEILRNKK